MNTILIGIAKIVLLTVAIWFTQVNVIKAIRGQFVSGLNILVQSAAIAAFIYLQWLA